MGKNGRRPLLQLLHPNSSRYFSRDDLASLDLSVPSLCLMDKSETKDSDGKESAEEEKDEQEDIVTEQSGLEENVTIAGSKKDPLLRRQELLVKSGLAEVAVGGCDGILLPTLSENLCELYKPLPLQQQSRNPKNQKRVHSTSWKTFTQAEQLEGWSWTALILLPFFLRRPCLESVGHGLKDTVQGYYLLS
ncbi:unnamed protein product [Brassica oleracea]